MSLTTLSLILTHISQRNPYLDIEYHSKNWQDFVAQMKKLYNHAKTEKRYTQRDLDSFISDKTHKFIHDLLNFGKYQRGFLRIGRWLLQHQKITDEQFRKSFWMGLPKHIHNRLESHMFQVHPTLSLTTPFPIEFIIEAAEHVYDLTRFDQETDEASEDDLDDSDTTSDSDLEEEEM